MSDQESLLDAALKQGVSRRSFLKFCSLTAASLGLSASGAEAIAAALSTAARPTVIWLNFQECTGCTESITRSFSPTLEDLILNRVTLEYQETLMAASGEQAEAARKAAMANAYGKYVVIIEGSIPQKVGYMAINGQDSIAMLKEVLPGAALVIAMGTCSSYGGLAAAAPNPSGAAGVNELMTAGKLPRRPLINVPGCPPQPEVMTGVITYYLTYKTLPPLDGNLRPTAYYSQNLHPVCVRKPFAGQGLYAKTFDDDGARRGWCLKQIGCRGPGTKSSCVSLGWNQGTSYCMKTGHGCIGCTEPGFWDKGALYAGSLASTTTAAG